MHEYIENDFFAIDGFLKNAKIRKRKIGFFYCHSNVKKTLDFCLFAFRLLLSLQLIQ